MNASNFFRRVAAATTDYYLMPSMVLLFVVVSLRDEAGGMRFLSVPLLVTAYLLLMAYVLLKDALPGMGGQSFGKKIWGVKVVKGQDKTTPCDVAASLRRNAGLIFPATYLVELFAIATDPQGRRFGDRWADTLVVPGPVSRSWAWIIGGFMGPTLGQSILAALQIAVMSNLPNFETLIKSNMALGEMALAGGATMVWLQWLCEPLDREGTLIRLPRWMRLVATLILAVSVVFTYRTLVDRYQTKFRGNMLLLSARNTAHDSILVQRDIGTPEEFDWSSANFPLKKRADGRFEMATEMKIKGPNGDGVLRGTYLDHPYETQALEWDFQGLSIPLDSTGRTPDTRNPDMAKDYYAAQQKMADYRKFSEHKDFSSLIAAWKTDNATILRYFLYGPDLWTLLAPAFEAQGDRTQAATMYARIAQAQLWSDLTTAQLTLSKAQSLDPTAPEVVAATEEIRRDPARQGRAMNTNPLMASATKSPAFADVMKRTETYVHMSGSGQWKQIVASFAKDQPAYFKQDPAARVGLGMVAPIVAMAYKHLGDDKKAAYYNGVAAKIKAEMATGASGTTGK